MKRYQGGCHCGEVRFEIETEPEMVSVNIHCLDDFHLVKDSIETR